MGAPSLEAVTRRSERRGPCCAGGWPDAASSARSTNDPASAPIWEPSMAPVSVAPRRETPAGSSAPPTAAPATARARVAISGLQPFRWGEGEGRGRPLAPSEIVAAPHPDPLPVKYGERDQQGQT